MSTYIIGVDPGDSTGVAIFKDTQLLHVFQGEPDRAATLVELILSRAIDEDRVTFVCERFTNARSARVTTHQPTAQRVIGVMQHLAETYSYTLELQGPADAHAIMTNPMLRDLKLLQRARDVGQPDANDVNMAVRHALLAMSKHHATLFESLLVAGLADS
jgi:hypothetical protein